MAQLKDLIVAGSSRFLGNVYFEDGVTLNDTLILAKSTDLSGTADNRPALIVGGLPAAAHIEIDGDEIQSKASGTTAGPLYINKDGGNVTIGSSVVIASDSGAASGTAGAIRIIGGISATNTSYFGGAVNVNGLATFSNYIVTSKGEASTSKATGDIRVGGGIGVAKASYFGAAVVIAGKLTAQGNVALGDASSDVITITGTSNITGPVNITGDTKNNGTVYFANGTTYYINNSGTGILNELTMLNNIYFGSAKTYYFTNTGTGYIGALTTNGLVVMNGGTEATSSSGQLKVVGGASISKKLYTGDTHYANGGIQLPNNKYITQIQGDGSNYTVAIKWLQGGVSEATYDPQIGHHTTAEKASDAANNDPNCGAIVLLPYSTDTSPWSANDGLYISKKRLRWNGLIHFDSSRNFYPTANNTGSIGTSSYRWSKLYITSLDASGSGTISGDLTISGKLNVAGLTTLARLTLTSTTDAAETSYAAVALTIGASSGQHLEIDNNEILSKSNASTIGTLYLGGNGGTVSITGALTASTTATVTGATTLKSTLNVTGKTTVTNDIEATASDTTSRASKAINSNGSVGIYASTNRGLYDFTRGVWLIYTLASDSTTRIPQPLYLSSSLNVAGATTLSGTATISGKTIIKNALNVTGAVDFDSTLNVDGNTTLKGTLGVTGTTTLSGALGVAGASTLTGAVTTGSSVTVKTTLNVGTTSTLTGNVTMKATASITGATTLSDTLTVAKTATFNSDVIINGGTESTEMKTGQLKVIGGIGATKYVSAKALRLDDAVKFVYNTTDKCVDVIFE